MIQRREVTLQGVIRDGVQLFCLNLDLFISLGQVNPAIFEINIKKLERKCRQSFTISIEYEIE
jgi:hypothetical protein